MIRGLDDYAVSKKKTSGKFSKISLKRCTGKDVSGVEVGDGISILEINILLFKAKTVKYAKG